MRILMRGAIDPLEVMSPSKFIIENHTGGNIGNLLYLSSIARTILTDGTVIDYVNLKRQRIDDEYIEYVNENYDIFLIPLANAFKLKGHDELTIISRFVKKLKIPCCIIGVGIQQMLFSDESFYDYYKYNDEAKEMLSAVLEKSPIIGVRGEYSADYLKTLGFIPEKDYTVIGCPSLFTYGENLPKTKIIYLTRFSKIAFNSKSEWEQQEFYTDFIDYLKMNMNRFENTVYVQQRIDDIRMIYLDTLKQNLKKNKFYDVSKAISFTNANSWIEYLKNSVDFSFGSRIHGNVAAILGGVPSVTVPFDKRVYELADYHNIPMIDYKSINEDLNLYDVFNNADFSSIQRGHKERFVHYIDFLHKIGLKTVYDSKRASEFPYDKIMKSRTYPGVIESYDALPYEEKANRYREAFLMYSDKLDNLKRQL